MTVFYKKEGDEYVPVAIYDSELGSAIWEGATLIVYKPGVRTLKHDIDPAFAPMIAAGEFASDSMCQALLDASQIRLNKNNRELTPTQHDAWNNLINELGPGAMQLEWPSAQEIVLAGVEAMQIEADKTLKVPAVKKAYEEFMLIYKLTKEEQNG